MKKAEFKMLWAVYTPRGDGIYCRWFTYRYKKDAKIMASRYNGSDIRHELFLTYDY
jgi:hypothetical protein